MLEPEVERKKNDNNIEARAKERENAQKSK